MRLQAGYSKFTLSSSFCHAACLADFMQYKASYTKPETAKFVDAAGGSNG